MCISEFIKKLCHQNKITVAELARRIGQSSQNLTQKIKRGTVSMDEMAAIAAAVDADYNQSFVMPDREIITLYALATGNQVTVSENTTGRNIDASLIPQIFSALFYVDLEENKGVAVYQSKWVEEKNKDSFCASDAIKLWIENAVYEADREKLTKELCKEAIQEKLKTCSKYSIYYRSTEVQDRGYHEVLIVRSKDMDCRYVYICHINRDNDFAGTEQQVMYKKTNEFSSAVLWSAVEEVYEKCFICNLTANEYRQVQEGMLGESFETRDGWYDDLINGVQKRIRNFKERESFLKSLTRASLLKTVAAGQTRVFCEFSLTNSDNSESRKEIRVLLRKDMFENDIAVILVSDVTENFVRDQKMQEITNQDQNYIDILETFTKSFVSAYKVNLDNDTYEIIKYNERLTTMASDLEENGHSWSKNSALFIENYVHPEDREAVKSTASIENLKQALENSKEMIAIYRDISKIEPEYYEMRAVSHNSKWGGNYAIILFSFANDKVREQMENQISMRNMLKEANAAIEAKKKFLFNMSHDIRTPMNAILGFAQIAMMNSSASPKLKECLDKILQSGDSLLQIINDVLEMSNLESGGVEIEEQVVHSENLGKGIISMIQQAAFKKNIKFSYLVSNVVDEEIYCDVSHVNQILINLLTNAINFTPEGGKVSYSIEQLPAEHLGEVSFCFEVKDNGIGISEEFRDHIFEAFSKERTSTESGVEGTGLGLTIAKRLADLMGGRIEFESEVEKGTTFRLLISFRKIRSNIQKKGHANNPNTAKGIRVLIVDDDRLNREVTKKMLKVIGVKSDEVENGKQALEKLEKEGKNYYSLVLMDVQMPEMDGYEATEAIRKLSDNKLAEIPIVAMTANEKSSDMKKCFAIGMNDFITKPINLKMLETVINHALNTNLTI